MDTLFSSPHRRYNPLTGEWVKVSPHRTKRPWQGRTEQTALDSRPAYDPECYLCPGNTRSNGEVNPQYSQTFSFLNDFSAILPENTNSPVDDGLFQAQPERGICKVLCFSPRHDLTIPRMSQPEVEEVVRTWKKEYHEIAQNPWIRHIQIFENHGSLMGCSNPHPHGQIWAENMLPDIPAREDEKQREYFQAQGRNLLIDYVQAEVRRGERVVVANADFVALVPYWAVWPYETIVLPRTQIRSLADFTGPQVASLADIMIRLGIRYDNLFQTDFPYSMGLHQAPVNRGLDGAAATAGGSATDPASGPATGTGRATPGTAPAAADPEDHWTFHMHYYPPLLRSAAIKKFMVGYEMMAMPQRDITPETAAEILREVT